VKILNIMLALLAHTPENGKARVAAGHSVKAPRFNAKQNVDSTPRSSTGSVPARTNCFYFSPHHLCLRDMNSPGQGTRSPVPREGEH
jgi:hypothetical protein